MSLYQTFFGLTSIYYSSIYPPAYPAHPLAQLLMLSGVVQKYLSKLHGFAQHLELRYTP